MRLSKLGFALLLLFGLYLGSINAETIEDFEVKYFKIIKKDPMIYPLDIGIKNPSSGNIIMAYGDFDGSS